MARAEPMTIEEIKAYKGLMLKPIEVSAVLGCNAESIRNQANVDPKMLGFPICKMNSEIRIPKIPFLRFLGVEE